MVHCPKPFDFENCKVLQHANVQVCERASLRVTREYARVASLQVCKNAIIQVCNFSSHQRVEVSILSMCFLHNFSLENKTLLGKCSAWEHFGSVFSFFFLSECSG